MRVPFEESYGRRRFECPKCGRSNTTGEWCARVEEHPTVCCACFEEKYVRSTHGVPQMVVDATREFIDKYREALEKLR